MLSLPLISSQPVVVFLLVLTRISGLVMTAPLFGARGAPMRIRGLLAVALALMLTPMQLGALSNQTDHLVTLAAMLVREAMLGLALGLAVLTVVTGVQIAGQLVSQIAGLSLADVFDPSLDANVSLVGQLLDSLTVAAFFCIGGHRLVMRGLLDSFEWQPLGGDQFPAELLPALQAIVLDSFASAVQISAPALAALLLAVLITGLISRALPQLNVLAVGLNLNIPVLLGALALTLGTATYIVQDDLIKAVEVMSQAMQPVAVQSEHVGRSMEE